MTRQPQNPFGETEASSREVGVDSLGPALERETKLLGNLLKILKQQREAVATEDLAGVDDTIFSAQRILRTLAEARIKRRTLLEILGLDPGIPMDDLEDALGPKVTPELSGTIETLRTMALNLTGELEVNRRVLQGAIQSGEKLIGLLGGGGTQDPGVYGPQAEQNQSKGDHGMILDRQI
jgi:hypothetical protein